MKGIELLETSLETWKICFQSLKYKVFVSVRINVDNCMARNPRMAKIYQLRTIGTIGIYVEYLKLNFARFRQ